ncbi:hypothetical protein PCIT_a1909 [Pseudoalteromonas citrea]|uniref:Uncharacterized protein n=2 Tax=Pseudoalteromonas citrea TaxID=43655 RepID=A0AAD4FS76_9GAMM|nr:hypothetical protein [Pseudoalteromonas citrea]KAF7771940.1 hypothetical protein PCIT_a1909 [Pseudoalteromonas citrea]
MHPLHADILEISPLILKQTDVAIGSEHASAAIDLSAQLAFDIGLANTHLDLTLVQKGHDIAIDAQGLILPSAQLNAEQKRQLWKLLSEY